MRIKKNNKIKLKLILGTVFALIISLVIIIDIRLRPVIETYSCNQAINQISKMINSAVYEEIEEKDVAYDNMVKLSYNDNGDVTALEANVLVLNQLQASITKRIIDKIIAFDSQTISVPIGTIIGGNFFLGRGPKVEIKVIPASFIKTKINNSFDSSGINQTRHRIIMDVDLTVVAVLSGYRSSTNVSTSVVLAETIIVGAVPEAYTMVGDGSDELVGIIQDYGAQKK